MDVNPWIYRKYVRNRFSIHSSERVVMMRIGKNCGLCAMRSLMDKCVAVNEVALAFQKSQSPNNLRMLMF